jgi:hypothetical protein
VATCNGELSSVMTTFLLPSSSVEASWLQEEDCSRVVEEAWVSAGVHQSLKLRDSLRGVVASLGDWRQVLTNIQLGLVWLHSYI